MGTNGLHHVEQHQPLSFVVLASDNGVLASKKLPLEAFADRKTLNEELREFTKAHALPRPDAKELLAAACNRARQEGKQVLLEESGTYCGWCRILARFFDRHPDVFEAYSLPVRIDRGRFAHGEQVMQQYRSTEGGIPWCAILDADGKKLADWDTPDGNMGYPTLPKEFDYLANILKQSAPKIAEQQLAELRIDLGQEAKKYQQH
jgi:Thioredoxin-like